MRKKKNRCIGSNQHRLRGIGKFYQDLTLKLIGDTLSDNADIENYKLDSLIEVKGRNNNDSFIIFDIQLNQYNKAVNIGFPFSFCLFFFFSYKNNHRTLTKESITERDLEKFLAKHTNQLYIIDLPLINQLKNKIGFISHRRDNLCHHALKIGRKQLRKIGGGLPQMTIKQTFHKLKINFDVLVIIKNKGLRKKVQNLLNNSR